MATTGCDIDFFPVGGKDGGWLRIFHPVPSLADFRGCSNAAFGEKHDPEVGNLTRLRRYHAGFQLGRLHS